MLFHLLLRGLYLGKAQLGLSSLGTASGVLTDVTNGHSPPGGNWCMPRFGFSTWFVCFKGWLEGTSGEAH